MKNKKNNNAYTSNENTKPKKSGWKGGVNIALSILLVFGILISSFGGYTLAKSLSETPAGVQAQTTAPGQLPTDDEDIVPFTDIPGGDGLNNEMTLLDTVKVFSDSDAMAINASITSIERLDSSFENGEKLEIKLSKSQEELFNDLRRGDTFVLEGDPESPFGDTYILKVDSIYSSNDETTLRTTQPYFDEVFDSVALNINEPLREDNLVASSAAPGVELHFGNIDEEFGLTEAASGLNTRYAATEYAYEFADPIFTIDFDMKKATDDDDDDSGVLETDPLHWDFKASGKFGIKDLRAYMIYDMPAPLQFNELFFGVRGEKFVEIDISADLNASFGAKATSIKKNILGLDIKASALDEKLIPLGIWQFAGTTPMYITNPQYKKLRIMPSIFFMLYMDAEGNISFETTASFQRVNDTFNGGLRLFEDGKPVMKMESYPYNVGNKGEAEEVQDVWSIESQLEARTEITMLGGSVLFCIAGLNIGEIGLFRLGLEAEGKIGVKASSDKGLETPTPQNSSLYLRGFVKLIEVNVRLKASAEFFRRNWSGGFDFNHCLVDITLFLLGNMPSKYTPAQPVSSKPHPDLFDSALTLVCDVSGSMDSSTGTGESKLAALKEAGSVITKMVKGGNEQHTGNYGIGVVQFASNAKTLAFPHIDYSFIEQCIQSMHDGGGTNIASGLELGIEQLDNIEADSKVIILMTDGQDGNHSEILKQAEDAKAKGIRVFTVGFGRDADEKILTQIADVTDGVYLFADTDNIVGIIASFMYAQQASDSEVLADEQGTVAQGEKTEVVSFEVPDKSGNLNGNLYWPGSILKLILVDPNGRAVDENYPGAEIDKSSTLETVVIEDPIPGSWGLQVEGIETSYDEEPYYAITAFKDVERAGLETPKLSSLNLLGAYCIPVGLFMILISVLLLVFVNGKKRKKA